MYPLKRSMSTDIINMLRQKTPIQLLVPSSYCIRNEHIIRLLYLIRRLSSLLDTHFVSMDPRNYSWLEKNGLLLPDKAKRQLPPALLKIRMSCKSYSTKRCVCVRETS